MSDDLIIWQPGANADITFDWGSCARREVKDMLFRVHNNSSYYTAQSVVISIEDSGIVATPSQSTMHYFSIDGVRFFASLNIGDLAPTATSPTIILRRVVPSTASVGLFRFIITAAPTSWL